MKYRISVDTGGTFTDVVVSDQNGALTVGKALTTYDRAFRGLSQAIESAAVQLDLTLRELLAATELFIFGTTRATNAIVTKQGAKTAFLTTDGFKDTLVFKEGGKRHPHDFSRDFPEPYILRRRTFEIDERMSSEGTVSRPLNENQVVALLHTLKQEGYEAIAVSFLWSIANAAHEKRVGELIAEHLPEIPFTLSHELVPIMREYRRASATTIDASLKPLMQRYLSELAVDLRDAGCSADLLVSTSIGGCNEIDDVIAKPIQLAKSGPSMAPVAARSFSLLESCGGDIIVADTGGTTFDVGLVRDGEIVSSRDTWLGGEWTGHLLGISSVDIRSVGSGGGSIAWIDDGGLLRVGPQSAGSEPGPACYGLGGDKPTVSDAACVLGYFDPSYFLGGRMKLDVKAARTAIAMIAEHINQTVEETAFGMLKLASESMIEAIHDITVAQGISPRESVIVAGGGAAGINIMLIAKELGCSRVLLPKQASALSASGMHFADIVTEESETFFTTSESFDLPGVKNVLGRLRHQLDIFREGLTNVPDNAETMIEFFTESRYASQVWEITTSLQGIDLDAGDALDKLVEAFHHTHERLFTLRDDDSAIEFLSWKAKIRVKLGIDLSSATVEDFSSAQTQVKRMCYFGESEPIETCIYMEDSIATGRIFEGPCVIQEPTTTIVVFPGMQAHSTANGHYILSF